MIISRISSSFNLNVYPTLINESLPHDKFNPITGVAFVSLKSFVFGPTPPT